MINKGWRYIKRKLYFKKLRKEHIYVAKGVNLTHVNLDKYVNIAHHAEISDATIGKRISIGRYTKIQFANIGKFCSISWDVTIGALEHPLLAVSTHAFSYRKKFGLCNNDTPLSHATVIIGNDVWIGCNAIIKPGVVIGNGAVIGAGAVVMHDVLPYEIVAGVPARHLNYRFPEEIRNKLNASEWWNMPDKEIETHIDLFSPFADITGKEASNLDELVKLSGK